MKSDLRRKFGREGGDFHERRFFPLDQLKSPVETQKIVNEKWEINPDTILLTHATNFPPQEVNGRLIIESSGNVDPLHESFRIRHDRFRNVVGVPNFRFTVHFGMPGVSSSHVELSGSTEQYDALGKRPFLIAMQLGGALRLPNTLCNLNATDTFFWDRVQLPDNSILIVQRNSLNTLRISNEAMNRYQIAVTDNDPFDAFRALLKKQEFKDVVTGVNMLVRTSAEKSLRLSDTYGGLPFSNSETQHDESIFNALEQSVRPAYLLKHYESHEDIAETKNNAGIESHVEILDEQKFKQVEEILHVLHLLSVYIVGRFLRRLSSSEQEESRAVRSDRKMRHAMLEKVKMELRNIMDQVKAFAEPLSTIELRKVMQPKGLFAETIFSKLNLAQQIQTAVKSVGVDLHKEFPQLNTIADILNRFIRSNQ